MAWRVSGVLAFLGRPDSGRVVGGPRRLGKRLNLFRVSNLTVRADPVLLGLLLGVWITLKEWGLPFTHPDLASWAQWGMATAITVGLLLSIIAREWTHVTCARRLGIHPPGLCLGPLGTVGLLGFERGSRWARARVTLSAMGFTIALAMLCFCFLFLGEVNALPVYITGTLLHLGAANLILAVLHGLPVLPLDGGRMLMDLLTRQGAPRPATLRFCLVVGMLVTASALAVGLREIKSEHAVLGVWIVLLGLVLLRAHYREFQVLRFWSRLSGETVRRYLIAEPVTVPPELSLARFYQEYLIRYRFQVFPVVAEDGELLGLVNRADMGRPAKAESHSRHVSEMVRATSDENTIVPNFDAGAAFSLMYHTGNSHLLVSQWGRLVGLISYSDIRKLFQNGSPT